MCTLAVGWLLVKEHTAHTYRRGHDARVDKYDKLRVIVCVHESLSGGGENADDPLKSARVSCAQDMRAVRVHGSAVEEKQVHLERARRDGAAVPLHPFAIPRIAVRYV